MYCLLSICEVSKYTFSTAVTADTELFVQCRRSLIRDCFLAWSPFYCLTLSLLRCAMALTQEDRQMDTPARARICKIFVINKYLNYFISSLKLRLVKK